MKSRSLMVAVQQAKRYGENSLRRLGFSDLSPGVPTANDLNRSLAEDFRTLDGAPSPSF
jgi:hypothetical protein